jgi:hypothetical protein
MIDNSLWRESHLPASRRHSIRQLHVLRACYRKLCVVSAHFNKPLALERRRIRIDEIDIRDAGHHAIAIFVFGLNESRNQRTLPRSVCALHTNDLRIRERLQHRIEPPRRRLAIVVCKQNHVRAGLARAVIPSSGGPCVRLGNQAGLLLKRFTTSAMLSFEPSSTTRISAWRPAVCCAQRLETARNPLSRR